MAYVKGQPFIPQFTDPATGLLMTSGTIEFYLTGTSTPTPYYTDSAGTSGGTSLTLDSGGQPSTDIYFDTGITYKLVVKNAAGATLRTIDPFNSGETSQITHTEDSTTYNLATYLQDLNHIIGNPQKDYHVVSCVLRQSTLGGGWEVLDDATHTPVGLDATTPVSESGGNITLNYNFTAGKIGSLLVTPDEGYAAVPLTYGATVGTSSATIQMFYPFELRINGTVGAAQSYLGTDGVEWSLTADAGAGTWVVTHPAMTHSDSAGFPVSVSLKNDEGTINDVSVSAISKTGFTLQAVNQICGRVSAGSIVSENVGPQTVAWDGTDTMTITHPTSKLLGDVAVVSEDPQYHAAVTADTLTTITIQFFNIATGALYTGASAPCDVRYMRSSLTPSSYPGGTDVYIKRGPVKVDAANVSDASSNLWVFGIFEAD